MRRQLSQLYWHRGRDPVAFVRGPTKRAIGDRCFVGEKLDQFNKAVGIAGDCGKPQQLTCLNDIGNLSPYGVGIRHIWNEYVSITI
jgi:hypothetical protein